MRNNPSEWRGNPSQKSKELAKLIKLAGMCLEGFFIENLPPQGYESAQYGFLYGLYKAAQVIDGQSGADTLADTITQYMTYESFPMF